MDVVEALVNKLGNDEELLSLLNTGCPVVYQIAPQGTKYPYIVISDLMPGSPSYGMDETATHVNYIYDIVAVAELESTRGSGYSVTKAILDRVYEILQNAESGLETEDGETICLRRGRALRATTITVSGDEQYLRRGHEWEIVISP